MVSATQISNLRRRCRLSSGPGGPVSTIVREEEERVQGKLNLDDVDAMKRHDRGGMLDLVNRFGEDLQQAIEVAKSLGDLDGTGVRNVVLLGMGGSAIGGDLVKAYLGRELGVPFQVLRHYHVPGWVGPHTLVLASSYSGNTEEALAALEMAQQAGARIVCLTSGGELERIAERMKYFRFPFPPGRPPRTALPFSFVGVLAILARAGLIPDQTSEVESSLEWVEDRLRAFGPSTALQENAAKMLARRLLGAIPIVYGSADYLVHVARRWASQFCENAKSLAYFSEIPEMNHNEIVGWEHPSGQLRLMVPIFLRDQEDHPRIQARLEITRELLGLRCEQTLEYWSSGTTRLERLWSLILLGDFASMYLAFQNGEDPTPVEVIDTLKARMRQF